MAEKIIHACDLCGKPCGGRPPRGVCTGPPRDDLERYAAAIDFRYSMGGWGCYHTVFNFSKDTLCNECWKGIVALGKLCEKAIKRRKDANAFDIEIREREDWKDTMDKVPLLWAGEPPS